MLTVTPPSRLPHWFVTAHVDDDDIVYVPAVLSQRSELEILFRAAEQDDVPLLSYQDHLYVSVDWLQQEFPERGGHYAAIKARILYHVRRGSPKLRVVRD